MRQRIVYKITCSKTGWSYIGASKNPGSRWSSHLHSLRRGTHSNSGLQSDWDRYGESNFEFRCLDIEDEKEDIESVIIAAHGNLCYNRVPKLSGLRDMEEVGEIPEEYETMFSR